MGLTSGNSVSDELRLCVFDLKRGQFEGQEMDKILYFYPQDVPFSSQLSVIGLSEGLITFTRMFSPKEACEVIEAERHAHIFFEAEADIWMVMVVEKVKNAESKWRIDALRKVLKEMSSLFEMFHGNVRAMLEREPGGGLARSHLHAFINDYLKDYVVGKKVSLPCFLDCLNERGTVQMLSVGREAALEVESLSGLVESCAGSSNCHSMIMFHDLLVSTTLPPDDTINMFTYAVRHLTPHALSSGTTLSSWSYVRNADAANQSSHATDVSRPLQSGGWFVGNDGFLATNIWNGDPTMWLKSGEKMYLCAYQYKGLTAILVSPVANGEMLKKHILASQAYVKMAKLEDKLTKGWGGQNAYHVRGYRYLLLDNDTHVSRASPPDKVATLPKESLLAMSKLRDEVDAEIARGNSDADLEICIRAKNNTWIIGQCTRGKALYIVLPQPNETLLYASNAVQKFSNRYCGGAFSSA